MRVTPVASCQRAAPSVMANLMSTPATTAHTSVRPYSAPAMVEDTMSPTPMPVAASSKPGPISDSFTWRSLCWIRVGIVHLGSEP